MSIKQAIEALEVAQDALDISQSLQESAKSNHHPKTLAAYERVSAALAALRSMPAEPVAGDWVASLKIDMEASAWDGVIQLEDALKNIDDALAATPHKEAVRMSEAEIREIADSTKTAEPGRDGYILPYSFARAVEQATAARLGVKMGDV